MAATAVLQDYLNKYTTLCEKKNVHPCEIIRRKIEHAVAHEYALLTQRTARRVQSERHKCGYKVLPNRRQQARDYNHPVPVRSVVFLTNLDLSYNEIGNKGALLLAKLIKDDAVIEFLNLKSNNIG
jgi:Leucine Rich repeat